MSPNPLLSIIIPHYNMPHVLPNLLDSILIQNLKSLEIIVVDDGSNNSCKEVLDFYRGKSIDIKLIEHKINMGTCAARLTGIDHVQGHTIAFADADDLFIGTDILEYHTNIMIKEKLDIVHYNTISSNPENNQDELFYWNRPFAPILYEKEIFASYTHDGHCNRAHTVWGKQFSSSLCHCCQPLARQLLIAGPAEDFFLTSLYYANAHSYKGSMHAGYYHYTNYQKALTNRAVLYLRDLHIIGEWFNTWLGVQHFPQSSINDFIANNIQNMIFWASKLDNIMHQSSEYTNNIIFREAVSKVDLDILDNALRYILSKHNNISNKLFAPVQRVRSNITQLKVQGFGNNNAY